MTSDVRGPDFDRHKIPSDRDVPHLPRTPHAAKKAGDLGGAALGGQNARHAKPIAPHHRVKRGTSELHAKVVGFRDRSFSDHRSHKHHAGDAVRTSLPPSLFHKPKFKASHGELARAAIAAGVHENLEPHETGLGTMHAFCAIADAEDHIKITAQKVTPTSQESADLTNIYTIVVEGKEYGILRTGVIDSKRKADEFVAVLLKMKEDIPAARTRDFRFRILSHQLNSFENESGLIEKQHEWIAYANGQLTAKKIGEVIHINTPSNRWHSAAKSGKGQIASRIYASVSKRSFKALTHDQEQLSRDLNMDSWPTYMKWLGEDLQKRVKAKLDVGLVKGLLIAFTENTKVPKGFEDFMIDQRLGQYFEKIKSNSESLEDVIKVFLLSKFADVGPLEQLQKLKLLLKEREELILKIQANIKAKIDIAVDNFNLDPKSIYAEGRITTLEKDYQTFMGFARSMQLVDPKHILDSYILASAIGAFAKEAVRVEPEVSLTQKKELAKKGYEQLKAIASQMEKIPAKVRDEAVYQKVLLMIQILGSQLGITPLDRGQEILAIQALNGLFGITSAINCKSGLDRTGLWHAVKLAIEKFVNKHGQGRLFKMITQWVPATTWLNKYWLFQIRKQNILDQIAKRKQQLQLQPQKSPPTTAVFDITVSDLESDRIKKDKELKKLEDQLEQLETERKAFNEASIHEERVLRESRRDIMEFRDAVLHYLVTVAIPITIASTGVPGVLWNADTFQENLIPLNFLSPTIPVNRYLLELEDADGRKREYEIEKFAARIDGKLVEFDSLEVFKKDKKYWALHGGEDTLVEPIMPVKIKPNDKYAILKVESVDKPLVKYNKDGTVKGMDTTGMALLTKIAHLRKS